MGKTFVAGQPVRRVALHHDALTGALLDEDERRRPDPCPILPVGGEAGRIDLVCGHDHLEELQVLHTGGHLEPDSGPVELD